MKKQIKDVEEFHKTYKLNIGEKISAQISSKTLEIESNKNLIRYELMKEENEEYKEAVLNNDVVSVADSLGDMLYVLCGTIIEHGMQSIIEEIFEEIHKSNMSKLDENGNPIYREDGKVLKGPNYFKPNIEKIILK